MKIQNEESKQELNQKINNSTQFKNLQKILESKNQQLKEFRDKEKNK